MAFDIWKGPNGTAGAPTSGDFLTAANWSTGAVPTASTSAGLGAGDYTVTLASAGAEVATLSVGAGATLELRNQSGPSSLVAHADSVNYGQIVLSGSVMYLGDGVTLTNAGTISVPAEGGYAAGFGGGTIDNIGLMIADAGGYGEALTTILNEANATIRATNGGVMGLVGTTTNGGLVEATENSLVTTLLFDVLGSVTNVSGSTLSGGRWAANGANSTLWLANTTISTLADGAVVTLDGVNANLRIDNGSGDPFYLESTLNEVESGATLEVLGGRDWTSSEELTVRGALRLGGGSFAPGDLSVEKDGSLSGFGAVAAQAIIDGLLRVDGRETLNFTTFTDFNGRIGGSGTLELSGGADTFTTSHVSVGRLLLDGADVEFDKSLKYAGELTATAGTIELKDSNLTLAGKATFEGDGVRVDGGPGGKLSVTGELHATGGTVELGVRTIRVDGAARVDHGALSVEGAVSGSGGFTVGTAGALVFEASSKLTPGPLVTLDGANATLEFDNLASNGARVAGFDGRDRIDFAALSSTGAKASWHADADGQGGTLRVNNGGQTASVHLEENHTKADFVLRTDAGGGTVVTLAKAAAFGLVDAGAFGGDAAHAGGHPFAAAHDLHAIAALV